MDSDKSVLRAFDPLALGKENTSFNPAFTTPTAKSSGPGKTNALTLSGFFNRYAHPRPRFQQTKLHGDLLVDIGDEEEKKRSVLASSLLGGDFAGGIRRESFPGKHAHVPDISFNIERVNEEEFTNGGTHLNDLPHADHPEAIAFGSENDQTPMPTTTHDLSTPVPREPNPELEQDVDMAYTIRMIPAPISPTRIERKQFPLASPPRVSTVDSSPVTAFKARTIPTWGPLPMRSASPTRIPSPTRAPSPVRIRSQAPVVAKPEPLAGNVQNAVFPKLKLDLGQGFEFALSEEDRAVQPTPAKSASVRPNDPQTLAGRAAAMRFVSAEQTLIEADSIMDVQLPDVVEDEATTGFLWSKGGIHKSESTSTLSRKVSVSSRRHEEPVFKCEAQEAAATHKRQESAPVLEVTPSVSPLPRVRCNSAASNLGANTTTSTLPEDEPTLNISALGLSALGNTLLVDTSLDQLTSQVGALGLGDGTFGGASFAAEYPSENGGPKRQYLDVKTPKVMRTMSNPLPERESSDMDVDVEATVKKPRAVKGRVVSDAVVNELRSGRALHRAASSISSVGNVVKSLVPRRSLSKEPGAFTLGESARRGPHQRTDSLASSRPTESPIPHPRAGSAALQRTESATSSHHSGSNVPHHQAESVRSQSRASSVAERDAEDEASRTRPSSTLSRPSSRLSSVYAASESSLKLPTHTERPGSAASLNDRPSSVASIRPPSVASTRTTSTRPESAASERPPSATSATATPASTHRRMLSGMSIHPMCTASENLQHLARGMEEDVRKEMQAFMLDDLEEYMRTEDDECMPPPRAAPLTKTKSVPAVPVGIREPGTAPRVRPRTSMLPPPVPAAKAGSKVPSTPRTRSGIIAPKAGSGSIAPKSVSAKSSSSTLGARSSGTTLGTRPATLGPASRTKTSTSGTSKIAAPTARSSASTTGSLRSRSATGPAPIIAPPLSVRGTRPPVAPSGQPKTLRPRSSSSGLAAPPKAAPEEEPRQTRPPASTISGRGTTGSKIGTCVGGGSLSRATSLSRMTAGSVASLRRR